MGNTLPELLVCMWLACLIIVCPLGRHCGGLVHGRHWPDLLRACWHGRHTRHSGGRHREWGGALSGVAEVVQPSRLQYGFTGSNREERSLVL